MAYGGAKVWSALVAAAVVLALPATAAAQDAPGPEGPVTCTDPCHGPDALIRRRTSPIWVGQDIYNLDSVGQTRVATVPRRGVARFTVRFDNEGTDPDTFVVHGSRNARHFLISYFVGGAPVSSLVRAGVYRFRDVPPGGRRVMTVEVRARNSAPVGARAIARVSVRSADEAGLLDRVKAVVYRNRGIQTRIEGQTFTSRAVAERWARRQAASPRFVSNARLYFELARSRGIRPEIAYAQSAKETAYGNFGGVLNASWRNPCGLKTTAGGGNGAPNAHQRFVNWRQGVTACIDHLALYAGAPSYPRVNSPDPRHFPSIYAVAPTVERLGGRWAPAADYGRSIVRGLLIPLLGS